MFVVFIHSYIFQYAFDRYVRSTLPKTQSLDVELKEWNGKRDWLAIFSINNLGISMFAKFW